MAASISMALLATHIVLLLCAGAANAAATTPGIPAVVNGAAPPPAAAAAAATVASDGQTKLPFPFAGGGQPLHLPFPFSGGGVPHHLPFPFAGGRVDAAECLEAVRQAESCVVDVLRSLVSPAPAGGGRAGAACCAALQAVGDRCFPRGGALLQLPVHPFRALFAALVKHACGGGPGLGVVPGGSPRA